ncbi:MAG: PIN domain-containing protein [Candidatus Latescibacteria bacterium]|nr:PIN domain-containing protein [Candidatus Latescibacterota bacterium]
MGIERLRAVLDTNIYVAAYLAKNPNSPTAELLKRWRNGEFDVLYSREMLYEIARKFQERGRQGAGEQRCRGAVVGATRRGRPGVGRGGEGQQGSGRDKGVPFRVRTLASK